MFTIEQIQAIHSKVKSGADFPAYIQELKLLGVLQYDIYVTDGRTVYSGKNDFNIASKEAYPPLEIAPEGNKQKLEHALKIHQQGKTDYPAFCRDAAEAGVEKWTMDLEQMTCTYYDKQGNLLVAENIPAIN